MLDVCNHLLLSNYQTDIIGLILASCKIHNLCLKDVVLWLMPTSNLPAAISLLASIRNHCLHYNLKQNTIMAPHVQA